MDNLFLLLFLLSPLALIIGLVKPTLFARIFKKQASRKQIGLIFGVATIIFFALFGITADTSSKKEKSQSVNIQGEQILGNQVNETQEIISSQITQASEPSPTPTEPMRNLIKVIRVIDGDTIEIEGGQKIRYIGIDTPETVDPGRPTGCYGKEASNKNKDLVLNKEVEIEKDISETDKYGRLLRYVWVGDLMVNEFLVREGYAMSSSYPPDVKHQERFVDAQRMAREEDKGLWGSICENWGITKTPTIPKPTATSAPIYNPQPTSAPVIPPPSNSYTCNCSKTCPNMSSCAEAQYQLNVCGCSARDGDKDGIACDADCQ